MNKSTKNTKRRNTGTYRPPLFMQEWKNFHFFICDGDVKESVTSLLSDRDYLMESKNQSKRKAPLPNQEKITADAQFFAQSLCERLGKSRKAKNFGLANIAGNVEKLAESQELTVLYFYISNLYGMVAWHVPYHLQRLPVNPDAFSMFLSIYANTFIECIAEMDTDEPEESEETEETEEDEEEDGEDE